MKIPKDFVLPKGAHSKAQYNGLNKGQRVTVNGQIMASSLK